MPLVGSPAAFALSSNHLSPSLGASGRVSGCLCFIFEPFVSQSGRLWSGLRLPLLYLRTVCLPVWVPLVGSPAAFALSSNHLSPGLGASGRVSGCLCFILSSNHLSPSLGASGRVSGCLCFIFESFVSQSGRLWSGLRLPLLYLRTVCLPVWVPLVGSPAAFALSSNRLSPSLGASGRVSGCLCFIFESFVSQSGCFWSGLRLPLLYLRIICLPVWAPLVGSPAAFALSSNHVSPSLGASGRVFGCLCFIFESFLSQSGCLWSGLRLLLLYHYLRIICLPAWALLVGSPAACALSSNHLSPSLSPSLGASGRVSGCFCFIFESFPKQFTNHPDAPSFQIGQLLFKLLSYVVCRFILSECLEFLDTFWRTVIEFRPRSKSILVFSCY